MEISGSEDIIRSILDALDNTVFGTGITVSHNIAYHFNGLDSRVQLIRKDETIMTNEDAFWLGYVAKGLLNYKCKKDSPLR